MLYIFISANKRYNLHCSYVRQEHQPQRRPAMCQHSVSRHLSADINKAKSELSDKLESVKRSGVTTDLWTHQHTNDSYITITAQYVDITDKWHVQTGPCYQCGKWKAHCRQHPFCHQLSAGRVWCCETWQRIHNWQCKQYESNFPRPHLAWLCMSQFEPQAA